MPRGETLINHYPKQELRDQGLLSDSVPQNQGDDEDFIDEKGEFSAELGEKALYGLPGRVVRTIEPHTEADNAATLINFLVSIGNLIGDHPYFMAASTRHTARLFAAIVGATGKGRKGTSLSPIKLLLEAVDPDWKNHKIKSGLSSGEGLIYQVRDEKIEMEPQYEGTGRHKKMVGSIPIIVDEGVSDKRLLVVEEEFASVLKVSSREGNTLSPLMRQAWDSGDIRTLTKNPLMATGAHISILGQITQEELLRYLSNTDISNGFANRYLWPMVRQSKMLPDGGEFHKVNVEPLVNEIKEILDFARNVGEVTRDEKARKLWHSVYGSLSGEARGMVGQATSRAEAQTLRLSLLYALLDGSAVVGREHLEAALTVWDYCYKSARFIFGEHNVNYDPIAMRILEALMDNKKLTRTEVSRLFSNNVGKQKIDAAINQLIKNGYVRVKKETKPGAKKPTQYIVPLYKVT